MTSHYLTEEASALRRRALFKRLADEAANIGPGMLTWPPESDFWRLPASEQQAVTDFTVERLVRS